MQHIDFPDAMLPDTDDDAASLSTVLPVLWSLERAPGSEPGSEHYRVGFRTQAGERFVVQLRAVDILRMADAVLNGHGGETAHPLVQ